MRAILMVVMVVAGCAEQEAPTAADAGVEAPVNTLAVRLALCGPSPGEAPVLDPATYTDLHGNEFIMLSTDHWSADAAYITASNDWANCITYGVKP